MELTLVIKPSMLGQYYERHCDKFLIYGSVGKQDYKRLGWVEPKGFVQSAAAMAGVEWEQILLKRLMEDDTCEVINLKKSDDYEVTLEGTVEALKGLKKKNKTIYLYQACFGTTPSFAEKYLAFYDEKDTKAMLSNRMFPDFIKAEYIHTEKKFRLTVIDAKNASFLKLGAEIQIALYVEILKCIIDDNDIDNFLKFLAIVLNKFFLI